MSNRPMGKLTFVRKTDSGYQRFELGPVWPSRYEGMAPSFAPFTKKDVEEAKPEYPRMTIEEAMKHIRNQDGFLNLDTNRKGEQWSVTGSGSSPSSHDDF